MRSATSSIVVGHPALAPVPKEAVEKDPDAFADMPIGNGPFKMAEPVAARPVDPGGPLRRLLRREGHPRRRRLQDLQGRARPPSWSSRPATSTSTTTSRPARSKPCKAQYGESADGLHVGAGKQILLGPEISIYYCVFNNKDKLLEERWSSARRSRWPSTARPSATRCMRAFAFRPPASSRRASSATRPTLAVRQVRRRSGQGCPRGSRLPERRRPARD